MCHFSTPIQFSPESACHRMDFAGVHQVEGPLPLQEIFHSAASFLSEGKELASYDSLSAIGNPLFFDYVYERIKTVWNEKHYNCNLLPSSPPLTVEGFKALQATAKRQEVLKDFSLHLAWIRIREVLKLPNKPHSRAAADEIRGFLSAPENQMEIQSVTDLRLNSLGLSYIPTEISLFTGLEILDLSNNTLVAIPRGSLPNSLRKLSLAKNSLKKCGDFPRLNRLVWLDLSNNPQLIKSLNFSHLRFLQCLDLSKNGLVSLPHLTQLKNLYYLRLASNRLSAIPYSSLPRSLRVLDLSNNCLMIVSSLLLPPKLVKLDLSWNRLMGGINFKALTALEELDLSNNALTAIAGWQLPCSLKTLSAAGNILTQLLDLSPLENLEILDLTHNLLRNFSFDLPDSLQVLILKNNRLQSIRNFKRLTELKFVNLSNNALIYLHPSLHLDTIYAMENPYVIPPLGDVKPFSPHNYVRFSEVVQFCQSQQWYLTIDPETVTTLGGFYNYLIACVPKNNPEYLEEKVDKACRKAFLRLPIDDQSRILSHYRQLAPDLDDFKNRSRFYAAVHNAVLSQYDALNEEQRHRVHTHLSEINHSFGRGEPNWGEVHAKDCLPYLAEALGRFALEATRIKGLTAEPSCVIA